VPEPEAPERQAGNRKRRHPAKPPASPGRTPRRLAPARPGPQTRRSPRGPRRPGATHRERPCARASRREPSRIPSSPGQDHRAPLHESCFDVCSLPS
jgi:hypothetical protein